MAFTQVANFYLTNPKIKFLRNPKYFSGLTTSTATLQMHAWLIKIPAEAIKTSKPHGDQIKDKARSLNTALLMIQWVDGFVP